MSKAQAMRKAFKASMIAVPLMAAASNVGAQSATVSATLTDGNGRSHTQSANCRDFMMVSNVLYMTNAMAKQLDIKMGARVRVKDKENNLKNIDSLAELKDMSPKAYNYVQKELKKYSDGNKVTVGKVLIANAIEAGLKTHLTKNHGVSDGEFDQYVSRIRQKCSIKLNL